MKDEVRSKGFTLIELIVVVAILASIGSIVVGTITFSLRGTNKTNFIENIRQNGNYTISKIARSIEYAEAFEGFSNNNFTDTDMRCSPGTTNYRYIRVKPFNSNSITYSITGSPLTIALDGVSFIDTDTIEVSLSSTFTCTVSSSTDVPVIGIKFILRPKVSSNLVERTSTDINFETSVVMRNWQR